MVEVDKEGLGAGVIGSIRAAEERGRIAERKAIVDCLRAQKLNDPDNLIELAIVAGMHEAADIIERGEHMKGQAHD